MSTLKVKDMKAWVEKNKDKYIKLLSLEDWQINIYIIEKNNPLSKKNDSGKSTGRSFCASGTCRTFYEYKLARIRLYAKQISTIRFLRRVLVHELAHVATACFSMYARACSKESYSGDNLKWKLGANICEMLAVQIENIVCGKDKNITVIQKYAKDVGTEVDLECFSTKLISKPKIMVNPTEDLPKSLEAQLEELKKDDPDYWYDKWSEALERRRKQKGELYSWEKEEEKPCFIIEKRREEISEESAKKLLQEAKYNLRESKGQIILMTSNCLSKDEKK